MNKQIDEIREMAKIIAKSVDEETLCDGLAGDSSMACLGCDYIEKEYCKHHLESATGLYNKGYRKARDVAREIFEEIEKTTKDAIRICERYAVIPMVREVKTSCYKDLLGYLSKLKKKYESEGAE